MYSNGLTKRALVCEEHAEREGRVSAEAIRSTTDADARELAEIEADEAMTRRALRILGQGRAGAYDRAERRTEERLSRLTGHVDQQPLIDAEGVA